MDISVNLDTTRFSDALRRLAAVSSRSLAVELEAAGKGVVVEAIKITPPANRGIQGRAAQKAGEAKIDRDLGRIFQGVELKGERKITHLFGQTDPTVGRKPPYIVKTKEKFADVQAIYNARIGRKKSRSVSRGQKAAWYVSKAKVDAIAARQKGNVGWLAGGFNRAATRLGVNAPAYMRRHASPGSVDVRTTGGSMRIVITNAVSYAAATHDLNRRLQFAVDKQANKMLRQIPHIVKAAAQKANFQAT